MKKVFKIALLVTALALAMTVSAAASYTDFAAVPKNKIINSANAVKYEVTATNTGATEAQCVVLVLKGLWEQTDFATAGTVPLTADSILYIDQQLVAGNNGTATFNVYPKSLPDSTVILTGLSEKPQVVGYTEGKGVTVSGTVKFFSGSVKRVADVTLTDGTNVSTCKTDVAGNFSFDTVPDGTYTLVATAESHVSYTKKSIVVNGTEIANLTGTLLGGGLNANADINAADLSVLLTDYNKTRTNATVPAADINDNNDINAADLSILLTNYNKTAITE